MAVNYILFFFLSNLRSRSCEAIQPIVRHLAIEGRSHPRSGLWLIPLSSWASARRSPSAQPTFLTACRFRCRTASFHSVSSAELCLAHHASLNLLFRHSLELLSHSADNKLRPLEHKIHIIIDRPPLSIRMVRNMIHQASSQP